MLRAPQPPASDAAKQDVSPPQGNTGPLHGDAASSRVTKTGARCHTLRASLELEFWQIGDDVVVGGKRYGFDIVTSQPRKDHQTPTATSVCSRDAPAD